MTIDDILDSASSDAVLAVNESIVFRIHCRHKFVWRGFCTWVVLGEGRGGDGQDGPYPSKVPKVAHIPEVLPELLTLLLNADVVM